MTNTFLGTLVVSLLLVLAAVIYYFYRPQRPPKGESRVMPVHPNQYKDFDDDNLGVGEVKIKTLDELEAPLVKSFQIDTMEEEFAEDEPFFDLGKQLTILHVIADEAKPFHGYELLAWLKIAGFVFGEKRIFHYPSIRKKSEAAWFSLANIAEPGYFDLSLMTQQQFKGVSFFMYSGYDNRDKVYTFSEMLLKAKSLQKQLGGLLADENREMLTAPAIEQIKNDLSKQRQGKPVPV